MERPIENCINELLINKEDDTYVLGDETIDFAIEIMHKHQKIEEIIADWESDGGAFEMSEPYWLRLIREVIEDGNDD